MNDAAWGRDGVLVLGARGMLGGALMAALESRLSVGGRARLVGWDVGELDVCDADRVSEALHQLRPSTVINAAAYTDVDGCEDHVDEAMAVNATAASTIGRACAEINAISVYVGTDYIFDGAASRSYRPDDEAKGLIAGAGRRHRKREPHVGLSRGVARRIGTLRGCSPARHPAT